MITTSQYPHENHENQQHNVGLGNTYQDTGYSQTGDANNQENTRPDTVGEPTGGYLRHSVRPREDRLDEQSPGVTQIELIADKWRQWHRQSRDYMMNEVCQHKKGKKSLKNGAKSRLFDDGFPSTIL